MKFVIKLSNFRAMNLWKKVLEMDLINKEIAERHRETKLIFNFFKYWNDKTLESKLNEWRLLKYADAHNVRQSEFEKTYTPYLFCGLFLHIFMTNTCTFFRTLQATSGENYCCF